MFYDSVRPTGIAPGAMPPALEAVLPYFIAGTELAIPLLLFLPRTRLVGVVVTVFFHLSISFSPTATALDFTLVLFALVSLFLPAAAAAELYEAVGRGYRALRARLPIPRSALFLALFAAVFLTLVWRLAAVAGNRAWMLLAPAALVLGAALAAQALRYLRTEREPMLRGAPLSVLHYAVVALLVFNAASPYLGIKTSGTFTMYSNLDTFEGRSNHFLFPRLPYVTLKDDLVTIHESSHRRLNRYALAGDQITYHELRRHLSISPRSSISYTRAGELHAYAEARENPDLVQRNRLAHKLIGHRPHAPGRQQCRWQ